MRIRNLLLSIFALLLLLGPMPLLCFQNIGQSIPSWISSEDAMYLSGNKKDANIQEYLNIKDISEGAFQEAVSTKINNNIPCKAIAQLTNASLQLHAIKISNIVFNYPVYPTFYNSPILITNSNDRLLEYPKPIAPDNITKLETVSQLLNQFAKKYSNIHIYLYSAASAKDLDDSPTAQLVSVIFSKDDLLNILASDSENYSIIDSSISYEYYANNYFASDHHWNSKGAYSAYSNIVNAMELNTATIDNPSYFTIESPLFYGTYARRGLTTLVPDNIDYIIQYDDSELVINQTEEDLPQELLNSEAINGTWDKNRFANRYSELFHSDYGYIEIDNQNNNSNQNLIIIGDSYTNSIERFFAHHYDKTYVIDPRYYNNTLNNFITKHRGIEDILILMNSSTIEDSQMLTSLQSLLDGN